MTRRWTLMIAGTVLLLGLAGLWAFVHFWSSVEENPVQTPAGITPEGYRQIRLGMTLKEIEHILGNPPGEYDHPPTRFHITWEGEGAQEGDTKETRRSKYWASKQAWITVNFDADGKAVYKEYRP